MVAEQIVEVVEEEEVAEEGVVEEVGEIVVDEEGGDDRNRNPRWMMIPLETMMHMETMGVVMIIPLDMNRDRKSLVLSMMITLGTLRRISPMMTMRNNNSPLFLPWQSPN